VRQSRPPEAQDHAVIRALHSNSRSYQQAAWKARVADAARRRLRREGHGDLQGPAVDLAGQGKTSFVIEAKAPRTVERGPLRALQLRARIGEIQGRVLDCACRIGHGHLQVFVRAGE
jgi:hypothetical protein